MSNTYKPIFIGDSETAYRDPACVYVDGKYYVFMTVSRKVGDYMYNMVGISESCDLVSFTEPRTITSMDNTKNFCSPGSIVKVGDEYWICVTSYPMLVPYSVCDHCNDDARLFFIKTRDFKSFTEPELIPVKGDVPVEDMGRMIDPYLFRDKDDTELYHMFFKQNFCVNHSYSRDLKNWHYVGHTDGGENACVVQHFDNYYLLHSPKNGIGLKISKDLSSWDDREINTLLQDEWEWASGRLTAAFAMNAPDGFPYRYILFFHGSRKECPPETHGAASVAMAFTNDFSEYFYNIYA